MTLSALIELFDEMERRRRRDAEVVRAALIRVMASHGGSISAEVLSAAQGVFVALPTMLDYQDVADELQVSLAKVKRLVADGELMAVKIGGLRRVRRPDFEAYVAGLEAVRSRSVEVVA